MFTRLLLLFILMMIVDIINHFGLKAMLKELKDSYAYKYNMIAYWGISITVILVLFISLSITGYPKLDYIKYRIYFFQFGFWLIFYFPRILFAHFVILQGLYHLIKSLVSNRANFTVKRKRKKSFAILKFGLIISFSTSLLVIYGMIWGKSNYKVQHVNITIEHLPKSFEGFTIAQFSDAHLGSFTNEHDVKKGLDLLQRQNADMIVFTGDMVNNIADEMEPYLDELSKLTAPFAKYSILGNHDMSDYVKWEKFELQQAYINKLIKYQEQCGFKMLLNQNIIIKKGKDSIAIIGVENWGLPPFKQYGKLAMAMKNCESIETKILLTHDPTHWKEEVVEKTDIDLTLSGHTHGMQMGIDVYGFRWSPIKYIYENWIGIYKKNNQYLYVNPGFGYIGFPGRIGIQPEITIFHLKSKKQ
jgi:uncharacterized protein